MLFETWLLMATSDNKLIDVIDVIKYDWQVPIYVNQLFHASTTKGDRDTDPMSVTVNIRICVCLMLCFIHIILSTMLQISPRIALM